MRFGIRTTAKGGYKNLTFQSPGTFKPDGTTNNTCLRIDGVDALFGEQPFHDDDGHALNPDPNPGRWVEREAALGTDQGTGRARIGKKSIWLFDGPKIRVTQIVEVVPGEQSGRLDTCLVRYQIDNRDDDSHSVGLRFLLDTYIGSNDGVPFLIPVPGARQQLCDTKMDFDGADKVPDYVQALERENLDDPGTIARLQLKLGGGIETPTRMTLGAWPNPELAHIDPRCRQEKTMWEVPVLPIKSTTPPDSAATIYWEPRELRPHETREVGFAYGLGNVASSSGGALGLTAGGSFEPSGEFTVTALVSRPQSGENATLTLPENGGFKLLDGDETQAVPPLSRDAQSRNSAVTWRIQAPAEGGRFRLDVKLSTGAAQSLNITIKKSRVF